MSDTPEMYACCDCEFDGIDACLLSEIQKIEIGSRSGMLLNGLIHHFAIYGLVEYEAYPCRYPNKPLCVVWPTEKLLNNPIVPLRYKNGRNSMLENISILEARAEKAEAENVRLQQRVNELLSEELTDGAVRERIQLRFNMHEVSQDNARLTKMVDWLAERCAVHCSDKCTDDANCSISHCLMQHCRHTNAYEWKEAARRAVADSEVKG